MQDKKIKILCLSFWTPPITRPQSILIGKMIPEWKKQGVDPVIITYDICGDWEIGAPVYKIPKFKINKYFNRIPPLKRYLEFRYFAKTTNAIKKIAQENQVDLIFSFSKPMGSNIIGAMLKKNLNIPFVSHFSDPWYDDPYKSLSRLGAKFIYLQENFIVNNSDKVIFTNEVAKDLIMKKYPKSWAKKAEVIPHCFDLKDYSEVKREDSDKFIISYIGAFYEKRNPEMLFKALKKVIDSDIGFSDKFVIKLIGATNDYAGYSIENIDRMLNDYNLKENTENIPPISYEESLKYMKLSDCLVVIDADMPGSPFLPSKVVDYAGSGTISLGITPTNSPTAQFLDGLGCKSFNYEEVDKLADYLKKLINKEINVELNQEFLKKYDVRATTEKLISQFKEVLDK